MDKYKLYRNKICNLIHSSKKQYFYEYLDTNLSNMKKTWEGINKILNRKSKNSKPINAIKDFNNNNKVTRDPSRISNVLNDHFASVGEKLLSKIPPAQKYYHGI